MAERFPNLYRAPRFRLCSVMKKVTRPWWRKIGTNKKRVGQEKSRVRRI